MRQVPTYEFRPLTDADVPIIADWLKRPHLVRWWGDPDKQLALIRGSLREPWVDAFLVLLDERPFGYLQCYDPNGEPDGPWDGCA